MEWSKVSKGAFKPKQDKYWLKFLISLCKENFKNTQNSSFVAVIFPVGRLSNFEWAVGGKIGLHMKKNCFLVYPLKWTGDLRLLSNPKCVLFYYCCWCRRRRRFSSWLCWYCWLWWISWCWCCLVAGIVAVVVTYAASVVLAVGSTVFVVVAIAVLVF